MAGQFDFTSPGAAFSDALTNTLVERKAQERQNLLDSLGVRAQQRADQEADRMTQYQNYEMQMGRDRNERDTLALITSQMQPGQDISTLSPDHQALLRKYNLTQQTPTMTAPPILGQDNADGTSTSGTPMQTQNKEVYRGTLQQQEIASRKQAAQTVIAAQTDPTRKQFLQQDADANGGTFSEAGMRMLQPDEPVYEWDPQHNKFFSTGAKMPVNAKVVEHNYPPASYTDQRDYIAGFTPRGIMGPAGFTPSKDGTGDFYPVVASHKSQGFTVGGKQYNGPMIPPGGVTADIRQEHQPIKFGTVQRDFNTAQAAFNQNPNAKNANLLQTNAIGMIRSVSSVPEIVKQTAIGVIRGDQTVAKDLMDATNGENGWTPAMKQDLDNLLSSVWSEDTKTAYDKATQPSGLGATFRTLWGK